MTITKLLKNEYIYSVITKILSVLIALAQSIIVARYLGAELKGEYSYIVSVSTVICIIITFGVQQAYPLLRKRYGKENIYKNYIGAIAFLFAVYFILAVFIITAFPLSKEVNAIVFISPLLAYSRVVAYVTLVESPNTRNTWWIIIALIDIAYITGLWLFAERNYNLMLSIMIFADLIKSIVYSLILKIRFNFERKTFEILRQILSIGFFPMLASLVGTLNHRLDVIMLRQFEIITPAMIGIYSIGVAIADKIQMIADTLKGVLMSKLAKGKDEHEVAKVARLSVWSSLLIAMIFFFLGEWGIELLYGREYSGAYDVMIVCALGAVMMNFFNVVSQYNIINGRQKLNLALLSISVIVNFILNLLLIPRFGLIGAATATCIGNIICALIFLKKKKKNTSIKATEMISIQKSDFIMLKSLFSGKKKET